MRVLLITPPMTQLNTPYPATAYLSGFLKSKGFDVVQRDFALELALKLFSRSGLSRVYETMSAKKPKRRAAPSRTSALQHFLNHKNEYLSSIDPVISFLQGKDSTLAFRIVGRNFLPEGPSFAPIDEMASLEPDSADDPLQWAFGSLGVQDRAKYYASLYLGDLAKAIAEGIDARFELARYAEKLADSQADFEPLRLALENQQPTLLDVFLDELTEQTLSEHKPDVVALTVPFPGNAYGAFRIAKVAKAKKIKVMMGGGWVNTELRSLKDPRVFDYVDYITLDDGERPMLNLLEFLQKKRGENSLLRTFHRVNAKVCFSTSAKEHDIPHRDTPAPDYTGLDLRNYLSILEMLNPMHRIWSDGRWNKLTLAHGCYWKKCSFCDVSLDYIGRYETAPAELLVNRIEEVIAQTKSYGFHFVDEAAPPAVLAAMAKILIERNLSITWWANIRFEKSFTPQLAALLAKSGCVAMSGGLEVASDRLLKLMKKGVSVEQVAKVSRAFSDAGIMVHAYLMYGFPTQTVGETIDSLERVRQLFAHGCLQSAYWHRFSATTHSPVGMNPSSFGISIQARPGDFAHNDLDFVDPTGVNHDLLAPGLNKALYNYMHGVGLQEDVRFWFGKLKVPKAQVSPKFVATALSKRSKSSRSSRSVR